eukprot:TRINITY_DN8412_c0_g2_i1.p1 TRINITY_DN8412_c0_g2~~TRINITY_DN8412_c0_g2_i1.p1  ORF type:complete len:243 (-),score=51.07 TRINITY_DN8412_c0_g2_i1:746-1474(-)
MNPVLLYYQARAFMELKMHDYALIIAKYACELAPDSASAWVLLARAYIQTGNYKYALLAIDATPVYGNGSGNDVSHKKYLEGLAVNRQKKVPAADAHGRLVILPKSMDFELSKAGESMEAKTISRREDKEQTNLLSQLGANWFSESEMEAYKNLSLVEKLIGWDELIRLRNELFTKNKNNDWDNPKIAAECIKAEEEFEHQPKNADSLEIIQKKGTRNFKLHRRNYQPARKRQTPRNKERSK